MRPEACGYAAHRHSDWRKAGSRLMVCGICHPPADGLAVITRSGLPPQRTSAIAAAIAANGRVVAQKRGDR